MTTREPSTASATRSKTLRFLLALVAGVTAIAATPAADAADAEAGRRKAESCAACHGPHGNSTIPTVPSLASQPPTYTYYQLVMFKREKRRDPQMSPFVVNLNDEDVQDLAAYYAAQTPAVPPGTRDPAPAPDGSIFIAVMFGNKIARFDPRTKTFKEWGLPKGARPHGLLVDKAGQVWYTGNGNGTIGHLDPATGKVTEHKAPSGGDPHTLVTDDRGTIWFTVQNGQRIGRLDMTTGAITEYKTRGNPYGLALDRSGTVWFCQLGGDRLGRVDPASGKISEMPLPAGSRPRRMSSAPDGSLWVTLYGSGKV